MKEVKELTALSLDSEFSRAALYGGSNWEIDMSVAANAIEAEGAKAIAGALGNLKNLIDLELSCGCSGWEMGLCEGDTSEWDCAVNKIGEEGAKAIAGALKGVKHLLRLYLHSKPLGERQWFRHLTCLDQITRSGMWARLRLQGH